MTALAGLAVGDAPGVWSALGFALHGDRVRLGGIELCLDAGTGPGVRRVTAVGEGPPSVDGLVFGWTPDAPPPGAAQPNGVVALDHVVVATDDLGRTVTALQGAGFELRRVREQARQAFLLAGPCLLEVTERRRAPGAAFWGLAFAARLDALAECVGDRLGDVRVAVQPGRRIATLRPDAGSSVPIAFLSPRSE